MPRNLRAVAMVTMLLLVAFVSFGCGSKQAPKPKVYPRNIEVDLSGIEAQFNIADIVQETQKVDLTAMFDVPENTILKAIERFYSYGFLELDDEVSSHVDSIYSPEAIVAALADLDVLSLDEDRKNIAGIVDSDIDVNNFIVYVNQDLKPSLAVVETSLSVAYMQKDKQQAKSSLACTFILDNESGDWRISAYSIKKSLKTKSQKTGKVRSEVKGAEYGV